MIQQHKEYTCKECYNKMPSFIELLNHTAEQHTKEAEGEKNPEQKDKCEKGEKERVENFVFSG